MLEHEVRDLIHIARSAGARYVTDDTSPMSDSGTLDRLRECGGSWHCLGEDDDDPVFKRASNLAANVETALGHLLDLEGEGEIRLDEETAHRLARDHERSATDDDEGTARRAV